MAVRGPLHARPLVLQVYRPAVLSRIIHIENDALGRFARHRPGGGLHYAVVGAEDVANGHRRGLPALRETGVLAHGVHRRALPRAYFGRLRQGGQRGRARHQQLQNAHAVAALGGGVAVGKGVPACAVLPRQVKAIAVIIIPRAKAVLEEDMVGGVMRHAQGDGAAAATVGPRQRDGGRIGCVVGEVEIHFRGSLPVENVHPVGHIPMEGGQAFGVLQGVVADLVAAHGSLARDSVVQIERGVHRQMQDSHQVATGGQGRHQGVRVAARLQVGVVEAVGVVVRALASRIVNVVVSLQHSEIEGGSHVAARAVACVEKGVAEGVGTRFKLRRQVEEVVAVAVALADGVVNRGTGSGQSTLGGKSAAQGELAAGGGGDETVGRGGAVHGIGGSRRGAAVVPSVTFEAGGCHEGHLAAVAAAQSQFVAHAGGGEVGIAEMPPVVAVVGHELQAYWLPGIVGEVDAHVGPRSPAHVVPAGGVGLEAGDVTCGGHVILGAGLHQLACVIQHTHHKARLGGRGMAGVFQHHREFQQQDGVVGVHGKLVGDGLRLLAHLLVAEPHHPVLSRREERQLVAGVGVAALLGDDGVPPRGDARILERILEHAVLAGHIRAVQIREIRALSEEESAAKQQQKG